MTYINHKTRLFLDRGDIKPERRRSEARLKTYPSAIDIRAWCGVVEDRRQHILELVTKAKERCLGKLIPIEAIIEALLAGKTSDINKLRKCLVQLWAFIERANLCEEDRQKLAIMREQMEPICTGKESGEDDQKNVGFNGNGPGPECVAKERHEKELEEINTLLKSDSEGGGSYKITARGPAKIITRVKGIRPNIKVTPKPGSGPSRPQQSGRTENAFSGLNQKDESRMEPHEQFVVPMDQTRYEDTPGRPTPLRQSSQRQYVDKSPAGTPRGQALSQSPRGLQGSPQVQPLGQSVRRQSLDRTFQGQPTSQSPQLQYMEQTPQSSPTDWPLDQSTGQPMSPSPKGRSIKGTPQGSPREWPLDQSTRQPMSPSPKGRSVEGTPQGSPREWPLDQSTGQPMSPSPKGRSPDQTVQGQNITQSPKYRETPQQQLLGQSLDQTRISPKRLSFKETQRDQSFEHTYETLHADAQQQDMSYQSQPDSQLYQTELQDSVFIRGSQEFTPILNSSMEADSPKSPRIQFDMSNSMNPEELRIQLQARETLCNELQSSLESIKIERDECRKKLESTLEELEAVKKLNAANPVIPSSCKEEIEALELEIKVMRSGNLSPEQEAEVIRKEVDVLKKYCMKLKSVEDENEKLKLERDTLKSQVVLSEDKSVKDNLNRQVAGIAGDTDEKYKGEIDNTKDVMDGFDNLDMSKIPEEILPYIEELKSKLKNLEQITRERDTLANKVQRLEKELLQYRDLPEDIDVYRNRSKMLDSALEERDKMSKKVEQLKEMEDELNQLKKKSSRVDQLEEELKLYSKNDKNIGSELKKANSRCVCLEKELENVKMERDSMRTRIEYMKKEIDMLRGKSKESEIYKVERDKLQIRVNELSHLQIQYENLLLKCKCLENAAAEKQMYKQKYEEILTMECQGDMLRSQVEAAKHVERERNSLVKQVGDLESCICDQEDEIKKLVMQIDNLCRNKDDNHCRMREALASMRAEIEKKDCLIAESEEKLAAVQSQLKSSIQGVSCETTCYKTRIEDLERELKKAQMQNETLKKQLNKNDNCLKGVEKVTKSECETVATMRHELATAKEENKKLRDIANKMVTLTGDEHVQNMLRQSQCAVKRVVEELGRQYKEWDNMKRNQKKGIFAQVNKRCPCKYKHVDPHHTSDSENEKLVEELEDIQREKDRLEQIVKQIQNGTCTESPQNELISLKINNTKLQEELKKEIEKRKDLEKKLKITV